MVVDINDFDSSEFHVLHIHVFFSFLSPEVIDNVCNKHDCDINCT